jgi:carbon monoxide dehydrogenase subunit G
MFKNIAIAVTVVIAALLIFAATRPDSFRVERVTSIKAPPEKVFALINDFHNWTQWSPWENIDPNLKRTYSGAASGPGTAYAWEGNNKVGQGRMEIMDSLPPAKITIKLDFLKPFEAHNTAEFTLEGKGDSTNVTWAMHGPSPYMTKVIGVFMSMDKMVGKDFETGLANLKAAAEK